MPSDHSEGVIPAMRSRSERHPLFGRSGKRDRPLVYGLMWTNAAIVSAVDAGDAGVEAVTRPVTKTWWDVSYGTRGMRHRDRWYAESVGS